MGAKLLSETEGMLQRTGRIEDLGVGRDAEKPAQDQISDAECLTGLNEVRQPGSESRVVGRIFAVCVNQDVDINQEHSETPSTPGEMQSRPD
jgi:hypothetical protein